MKNYKLKTEGRNEEILAKAKELGYTYYNDYTYRQCLQNDHLFFKEDGYIGWGEPVNDYEPISVNDFLRLDWTPTVGEEVEIVGGEILHEGLPKGSHHPVYEIDDDDVYIIDNKGDGRLFLRYEIIPIYPKKKLSKPEEKPDAYIVDQFKQDKDYFLVVHRTDDGKETESEVHFNHLCKFNLLFEADYKAKYPSPAERWLKENLEGTYNDYKSNPGEQIGWTYDEILHLISDVMRINQPI